MQFFFCTLIQIENFYTANHPKSKYESWRRKLWATYFSLPARLYSEKTAVDKVWIGAVERGNVGSRQEGRLWLSEGDVISGDLNYSAMVERVWWRGKCQKVSATTERMVQVLQ